MPRLRLGTGTTSSSQGSIGAPCYLGSTSTSGAPAASTSNPYNIGTSATSSAAPLVGLTVSFGDVATDDTSAKVSTTATTPRILPSVASTATPTTTPTKSAADHFHASHLALLIGVFILSMVLY